MTAPSARVLLTAAPTAAPVAPPMTAPCCLSSPGRLLQPASPNAKIEMIPVCKLLRIIPPQKTSPTRKECQRTGVPKGLSGEDLPRSERVASEELLRGHSLLSF